MLRNRKFPRLYWKVMVRCNSIRALFCKSDGGYNIYDDDQDSLKVLNRPRNRVIVTVAVASLIAIGILVTVILLRDTTPKATYNRENDPKLRALIEVSPAAAKLPKKGQLFCWVQTSAIYHDTRSMAINETWIHRCDHGQLFTSEKFNDTRIPYSTVFAGIPDDYHNLFFKSRYAFYHIYTNISSQFDWYLKADDDTYVVVEHLKTFLSTLNPDEPHYLGYVLKPYLKNGYNAGGAGYILSKAALKIFAEKLYPNASLCPDDIYEDVGIGRCLANAGIFPEDTRNSKGQNRFNTFSPKDTYYQTKATTQWVKYPEKKGYSAFADDLISFHKLSPDDIRLFDILLYRIHRNH